MPEDQDLPIDPEVDSAGLATRPEWDLLAVIGIGGVLGAEVRYGLGRALAHHAASFPWSTVLVNVVGSALLGLLMAVVDIWGAHRLVRPFVGVGILGGFTTFSTFAVDIDTLLHHHRPASALAYLVLTVVGCFVAVLVAYRAMARAVATP